MIRSLKGKINALRFVPNYIPAVLWKYMILKLSVADLESITSELYRATVKIVKLSNPLYASFLQDIDTRGDYQAYRRSLFMK